MDSKRDFYFDNLKGFLILSVIIGNSLELVATTPINIHYFILVLYMFHMPMFTFVSGYFSKKSKRTTAEKAKYTFKLYCFAQAFYFIFYKILSKDPEKAAQLLAPEWTLWYLLSLTCWYILSDLVKDKKKCIIYTILISLIAGFDPSIGTLGSVSRTIFFFPFFIGGIMFEKEHLEFIKKHIYKFGIGAILTLVVLKFISHKTPVSILFEYSKYTWVYETNGFPFILRGFHYIGAFLLGGVILISIYDKKCFLSTIGYHSLLLYLTHSGVSKLYFYFELLKYNSLINLILSELLIVSTTIFISFSYVKFKALYKKKKNNILQ